MDVVIEDDYTPSSSQIMSNELSDLDLNSSQSNISLSSRPLREYSEACSRVLPSSLLNYCTKVAKGEGVPWVVTTLVSEILK